MDADDKISITVCGDGGCGKSSITLRLVRSQWMTEYDPTIEDSYSVTRTVDGQTYQLHLTDTAGQEEYRGLWTASTLKSDAFLLVYDITNADTLRSMEQFESLIEMETEQRLDQGAVPPVKIVAGNKCDLSNQRQIKAGTGLEWARQRGCGFMETSAREMVNIEETFALIVRRVVEARREQVQSMSGQMGQAPQSMTRSGTLADEKTFHAEEKAAQQKQQQEQEQQQQQRNQRSGGESGVSKFLKSLKCW